MIILHCEKSIQRLMSGGLLHQPLGGRWGDEPKHVVEPL
jgi:hypothetical protein